MALTQIRSKESDIFDKLIVFSLLLSPILQTYGWGKFDFSFILTSILSIIYVIKRGFKSTLPKILTIYFIYRVLVHIISFSSLSSLFPLGILKIYMAYIMFFSIKEMDLFYKYYKNIAIICLTFFYIQEFSYHILNHRIYSVLSFMPFALDYDSVLTYYAEMDTAERSSSFFSEPAMFVQFLLPLLAICLLSEKYRNYPFAAVITLSLLLMQSGNALLGILIILICFLIGYFKKVRGPVVISYILIGAIIIGVSAYVYISSDIGQQLLQRRVAIRSNSVEEMGYAGSGFVRIYRGYGVYEAYDPLRKIIGNDDEKYILSCISKSDVSSFFLTENDLYFNTFQTFLLFTGIVGAIMFFFVIREEWKQTNIAGKTILLTFVGLSFISSLYLTDTMALYLLLPMLMNESTKKKITITT